MAAGGDAARGPQARERSAVQYRAKAIEWMRAELATARKLVDGGDAKDRPLAHRKLSRWKAAAALSGLRDAGPLAALPADERRDLSGLWAQVDSLLRRAEPVPAASPSPSQNP